MHLIRGLTNRDVLIPIALAIVFIATRAFTLWSVTLDEVAFVANDVGYYGFYLNKLSLGESDIMLEYPVPAVWLLQLIYWAGGGQEAWVKTFVLVFLALDALVAVLLYRPSRPSGSLFWILFTGALGGVVLFRFDLIPAAMVAIACRYALRLPKIAGGAVGLGAAVKLWPALLIAPLLAPHPARSAAARSRLLGFLAIGFGLATASLITSGWARSASPLIWQAERGLQIESVPATVLMGLRAFSHLEWWHIELTEHNAVELISGPGVSGLLTLSTALTAATVVVAGYLGWRMIRRLRREDHRLHEAMVLAILAIVVLMVVANKTLSPQYITWLGGPVAVLLVIRKSRWLRRPSVLLAAVLLAISALTQLVYPWGALGILAVPHGSGPETALLMLRNSLLILLSGYTLYLAHRATRGTSG